MSLSILSSIILLSLLFPFLLLFILLSLQLLRLGSIKEFLSKAMEPPPIDAITEAELALREMNALDENHELTPLGSILARLPIEPALGKMIVLGCLFGVGDAICTVAAASTFPEPFLTYGKRLPMMHRR